MPQTVLITGCSSGIGKVTAELFFAEGWNVVATMPDPSKWRGTVSERVLVSGLDVGDAASIDAALAAATARFNRVDCVVNNAGQALLSVVETTPIEKAQQIFEINLFGTMRVMQAVLPHFRQHGGGRLVNVSSGSAITPDPFMAIYAASKSAVEALTEGMRFELADQGVTLKLVEPGRIPTTNFDSTVMANSRGIPVPESYKAGLDEIIAFFSKPPAEGVATEGEVAQTILAAATDRTATLRFLVGKDVEETAHMRRETSEAEYLRWSSARFSKA